MIKSIKLVTPRKETIKEEDMRELERTIKEIEELQKQEQTNSMQNSTMWRFMSSAHIPVWKKKQY